MCSLVSKVFSLVGVLFSLVSVLAVAWSSVTLDKYMKIDLCDKK